MAAPVSIPTPRYKSLWLLIILPLVMMLCYIFITYPHFCNKVSFIWAHLFIFALWALSTLMVMVGTRDILIRLHWRLIHLPTLIIPALSCYFLYVIYLTAFIGNISWDETLGYTQVLGFIPHLFDLTGIFEIPPAVVVAIFVIPLITFLLVYHSRFKQMIIWHWVFRENFSLLPRYKRRTFAILGFLSWATFLFTVASADTSQKGFFNFANDPIVTFFKPKPTFFAMTRERLYWSLRDRQAEKALKRKIPRSTTSS